MCTRDRFIGLVYWLMFPLNGLVNNFLLLNRAYCALNHSEVG